MRGQSAIRRSERTAEDEAASSRIHLQKSVSAGRGGRDKNSTVHSTDACSLMHSGYRNSASEHVDLIGWRANNSAKRETLIAEGFDSFRPECKSLQRKNLSQTFILMKYFGAMNRSRTINYFIFVK